MASVSMPPRQRMINMMYLVLTAMLAMNVSKEVLDAFAVLDADLVRSERAHEQRSLQDYAAFDDAAGKFPERYGDLRERAQGVHMQADGLVQHIEGIKARVIAEVEGGDVQQVMASAPHQRDSLLSLMRVEAKDDRQVLTRMLVGSEPSTPRTGEGSAWELKQRIIRFREQLKAMVGEKEPHLQASLDLLFKLDDRHDASGTLNNWESINFYDVPLAAGVAALSKLQADVRSAENDMVKWLFRSATQDARIMSSLASAVVPRSTVVMLGDSFVADVFLAAYDEKNKARISLSGEGDLPLGSDGKGKLRLRTGQVGEHTAAGVIHYQGAKGMEEYPYSIRYQVMAPLLVASPTKMNVFYIGVDNPLSFSVPGVTPENVRPVIDNGSIVRRGDGWFVRANAPGKARVSAVATLPDGSTRTIGPVEFRVKHLPPPVASVNGITAADGKVRVGKLTDAEGITVKRSEGCEFDEPYRCTRFTVVLDRNGTMNEHTVLGNRFDEETRKVLRALRPGDRIWFEGIKGQLSNGAGPEYPLPAIAVKVIR